MTSQRRSVVFCKQLDFPMLSCKFQWKFRLLQFSERVAIFENLQPLNGILSKKDKILRKGNRKFAVGLYVKYVRCFLECILLVKCACYLLFVTMSRHYHTHSLSHWAKLSHLFH